MSRCKRVAVPWPAVWLVGALLTAVLGVSAAEASAAPYRTEVLSDAPRAYWRLGETQGGSASDETANNLSGAYQNGVTLGVPGAIPDGDHAPRFDGVDDQVNMGDPSSGGLDFGTGDISVEAWIRTAVTGEQVIASKQGFSGPYWQVTVTDDFSATGTIRARLNNGSLTRQAYGPAVHVDDGAWHHVVVLFARSSGITIYIDKTFFRQTSGAMTGSVSNSASLLVGGRTIDSYPAFNGDLDEVAVYPGLLTPSRIQAHYDAVMADDVTPPSVSIASPTQNSFVNDTTPTFSGAAGMAVGDQAAVRVKIYSGSLATGTPVETVSTIHDSTGAWSADASPALPVGTYTAQAEQNDAIGHTGGSIPVTFSVVQPPPESPTDPVLVAAGDISDCGTNGDEATAVLLDNIPGTVGTIGDNAYESGTAAEFANCYDPTWGRHKARTRPSPGDHDYETPGAAGYFQYFGAAAGDPTKGYYSYDLGTWHIVMLNAGCGEIGGCEAGSAQEQWLRADLAAHPTGCTLSVLGNPLYSSNNHVGNDVTMTDLWQALHEHGTDVVLTADDHDYERFAAQDPNGRLDLANGITEFVVGTGGRSHYAFPVGLPAQNSQVRNDDTFGVLKLALHPSGYDWNFVPVAGRTFTDSGSRSCHNPTVQTGTIIAKKDAQPNDPQDFSFTAGGGLSPTSFSLDDDSDPTLSDTHTFNSVPTGGGYSLSEAAQAGWDQSGASCDDGSSPASIDVAPGETVTCTFANQRQTGTVVVKKDAQPDDPQDFSFTAGGGLSPGSLSLDDDSDPTLSDTQTFASVPTGGGYSISEAPQAGWDQTGASCDDGSSPSNIDVSAGETVTCTFINRKRGQIVLVESSTPDDPQDFDFTAGGGLSPASFNLDDDADPTLSNAHTFADVVPGSGYSLDETVPSGWDLTSASCDDGSSPSSIDVAAGETVTCTFTNRKRGQVVVVEDSNPNDPQDFDFTAGGGLSPTSFSLDDDSDPTLSDTHTFADVVPGSGYSLDETSPPGWDLTSSSCDDGSSPSSIDVSVGETVTCTFTNQRQTGTVVVKKDAQPDDPQDFSFTAGGGLSPGSFSLDDDPDPTLSDTQTFANVPTGGGYSLAEAPQAGWDQTGASCDDSSSPSSIDVAPGETVTCTFTNRKRGQVVVVEDSNPNDPQDFDFTAGGGLSPTSFSLDDDSDPTLSDTHTFADVVPGSGYSLDETSPSGWDLTSASCDDGSSPSSIDVAPGETVTCTFTNAKLFYGSPQDAGLLQVPLVPAYKECGTPGNPALADHAAPLAIGSCSLPRPTSLIARTGDSNAGTVAIAVTDGDFAIQVDDSDIRTAAGTDYDPNTAGGADLSLSVRVRGTDLGSCTPSPCSEPYQDAATLTDFELGPIPVQCTPAGDAGPPGSDCQVTSSANSLVPGFVAAGRRTVLQLFRVRVVDANNGLFQQQGVFTP